MSKQRLARSGKGRKKGKEGRKEQKMAFCSLPRPPFLSSTLMDDGASANGNVARARALADLASSVDVVVALWIPIAATERAQKKALGSPSAWLARVLVSAAPLPG